MADALEAAAVLRARLASYLKGLMAHISNARRQNHGSRMSRRPPRKLNSPRWMLAILAAALAVGAVTWILNRMQTMVATSKPKLNSGVRFLPTKANTAAPPGATPRGMVWTLYCCAGTKSFITALRIKSGGNRPWARIKS